MFLLWRESIFHFMRELLMSRVFISVVSHGHIDIIKRINCLKALAKEPNIEVIVKENTERNIKEYCDSIGVHYVSEPQKIGFGENNNKVFEHCVDYLGMKNDDYFIVLNPDVSISSDNVNYLISKMNRMSVNFSCINLFKDENYSDYDLSVRKFPTFTTFFQSLLFNINYTIYNRDEINEPREVHWAAGSFLAFKSSHYKFLGGFDKSYFMYCEDIDICYRSNINGVPLIYYPDVKAIHLAQHRNRKIMSKHFYWHVKNAVKFLIRQRSYERKVRLDN